MSPIKLEIKRFGYDPFLDFLKGICIILIILNHCIPSELRSQIFFPLWGSPAVPVFLIIQVFHFYKKGFNTTKPDYNKIWKRVVRPFIIVELIILAVLLYKESSNSTIPSLKEIVYMLTGGPGSYYPWIYVQFAVLLPLFRPIVKLQRVYILIAFILLSQIAEIVCALSAMPEWIYRLTLLRYVFLVYLGYLLATKGLILNRYTITLSVLSIASTILFAYIDMDYNPIFYNVDAWSTCHWICYFYIVFFMIIGLKVIYSYLGSFVFSTFVKQIGKYSYEIYLFQLLYFTCISEYLINVLSIANKTLITIILSTLLCIIPVLLYKRIKERLKKKQL